MAVEQLQKLPFSEETIKKLFEEAQSLAGEHPYAMFYQQEYNRNRAADIYYYIATTNDSYYKIEAAKNFLKLILKINPNQYFSSNENKKI